MTKLLVPRSLGSVYADLGTTYGQLGEFDQALFFNEALQTRLKHLGNYHYRVAETYNNIGVCLQFRGDLSGAIECYLKAIQINEVLMKRGAIEPHQLASDYRNVSIALSEQGDTERAIAFLHLGLQTLGATTTGEESERMRGLLWRGLAGCFSSLGDDSKSIVFYEIATAHFQANEMEFSPEIGLCYANLAVVYNALNQQKEQEIYLQKALQVWDTIHQHELPGPVSDIRFVASAYKTWGETDLKMGRLAAARQHTLEALQWAQVFSSQELIYIAL